MYRLHTEGGRGIQGLGQSRVIVHDEGSKSTKRATINLAKIADRKGPDSVKRRTHGSATRETGVGSGLNEP